MPGARAFQSEVTIVSKHGLWLLARDEELFLPFSELSWFEAAAIELLCDVGQPSTDQLYWPSLDVDLALQAIREPPAFPLIATVRA